MKRALAVAVVALATFSAGSGAALANTASTKPHKWLVALGHYNKDHTAFHTITVYVTGVAKWSTADARAIKQLKAMGAPAPSQVIGTERVIVKAANPNPHKWLVVLGASSRITVFVPGKSTPQAADATATSQLGNMGATAPDQTDRTEPVIVKDWNLNHH